MTVWLNLGSGEHRAPTPWVNLDVHADPVRGFVPDVLVDPAQPFATIAESAGRIYLGHVLEHTAWPSIPGLLAQARAALAGDGEILVTGPDVYRTIHLWRDGELPWEFVELVLEHADLGTPEWPQESHWWNCHETRVERALTAAGFVTTSIADPMALDGWPVVGWASWQCAVLGTKRPS